MKPRWTVPSSMPAPVWATATLDLSRPGEDLRPLFDTILEYIPAPEGELEGPAQVLISTIDYNDYVGRIGIGRISRGTLSEGMTVIKTNYDTQKVSQPASTHQPVYLRRPQAHPRQGGLHGRHRGHERHRGYRHRRYRVRARAGGGPALCEHLPSRPLPWRPSRSTTAPLRAARANTSPPQPPPAPPLCAPVSCASFRPTCPLRVNETDSPDAFEVRGRGELHLSILIENMRRQGYEFPGVQAPGAL